MNYYPLSNSLRITFLNLSFFYCQNFYYCFAQCLLVHLIYLLLLQCQLFYLLLWSLESNFICIIFNFISLTLQQIRRHSLKLNYLMKHTTYQDTQIEQIFVPQNQKVECRYMFAFQDGFTIIISQSSAELSPTYREFTFLQQKKCPTLVKYWLTLLFKCLVRQQKQIVIIKITTILLFLGFFKINPLIYNFIMDSSKPTLVNASNLSNFLNHPYTLKQHLSKPQTQNISPNLTNLKQTLVPSKQLNQDKHKKPQNIQKLNITLKGTEDNFNQKIIEKQKTDFQQCGLPNIKVYKFKEQDIQIIVNDRITLQSPIQQDNKHTNKNGRKIDKIKTNQRQHLEIQNLKKEIKQLIKNQKIQFQKVFLSHAEQLQQKQNIYSKKLQDQLIAFNNVKIALEQRIQQLSKEVNTYKLHLISLNQNQYQLNKLGLDEVYSIEGKQIDMMMSYENIFANELHRSRQFNPFHKNSTNEFEKSNEISIRKNNDEEKLSVSLCQNNQTIYTETNNNTEFMQINSAYSQLYQYMAKYKLISEQVQSQTKKVKVGSLKINQSEQFANLQKELNQIKIKFPAFLKKQITINSQPILSQNSFQNLQNSKLYEQLLNDFDQLFQDNKQQQKPIMKTRMKQTNKFMEKAKNLIENCIILLKNFDNEIVIKNKIIKQLEDNNFSLQADVAQLEKKITLINQQKIIMQTEMTNLKTTLFQLSVKNAVSSKPKIKQNTNFIQNCSKKQKCEQQFSKAQSIIDQQFSRTFFNFNRPIGQLHRRRQSCYYPRQITHQVEIRKSFAESKFQNMKSCFVSKGKQENYNQKTAKTLQELMYKIKKNSIYKAQYK